MHSSQRCAVGALLFGLERAFGAIYPVVRTLRASRSLTTARPDEARLQCSGEVLRFAAAVRAVF